MSPGRLIDISILISYVMIGEILSPIITIVPNKLVQVELAQCLIIAIEPAADDDPKYRPSWR
jgi:hypothetical protein